MDPPSRAYDRLVERFTAWAASRPDVRAAMVVGSGARRDRPADRWSDLDVVVVAAEPESLLATTDWLDSLGTVWITFLEPAATGQGMERRVLFEGGLDVDVTVVSPDAARRLVHDPQAMAVLARGVRVLLDKDGLVAEATASSVKPPDARPPARAEFDALTSDFWYHAVWTAKKLRRGELWTATLCCDGYMKRLLLRMLEWHARATRGWRYDTWHNGRFLEEWADPQALRELRGAFARYDQEEVGHALLTTMSLFRWLAQETAAHLGYPYDSMADERASRFVEGLLAEDAPVETGEGV